MSAIQSAGAPLSVRIVAPSRDFEYQARHPLDVAEVLARNGFQVEVVAPMTPGTVREHAARGFRLVASPVILSRILPRLRGTETILHAFLAGLQPVDIVIGVDAPGFMAAHLLWRMRRARTLVYYAMELSLPQETDEETVAYQARYIHDADSIVATGDGQSRGLREAFGLRQPPSVIHNSFVVRESGAEPALEHVLEANRFSAPEHLAMYAGALSRENAIPEILESVRDWPPNVGLVLIGFGTPEFVRELRCLLRQFAIEDRAIYLGQLPPGRQSVLPLLAGATLGFALKKYRGRTLNDVYYTSSKLFEYGSVGLPVVCSDQDSMHFVEEEGWGVCVDPESPACIAAAVSRVLATPGILTRMGDEASRRFRDVYCMEQQMVPFMMRLRELVAAG